MKMKKYFFAVPLIFISMIFSSCFSSNAAYLMYVATRPAYNVQIEVTKGSVYISGTKSYNSNLDSRSTANDPMSFSSVQTNIIKGKNFSKGEKFSEKINYGYEINVTVQAAILEVGAAEIEVTDEEGVKNTYRLELAQNSRTFVFSNNFN